MRVPVGFIILLSIGALIAFEWWRLSVPETIRMRQTWQYDTAAGPKTISNEIELRQYGAMPYLPGGEIGRSETIGDFPVRFSLSGETYFLLSDPRWLLGIAANSGDAPPPLSLKGLRGTSTTGFIRRLRRVRAPILVDFERWPPHVRNVMKVGSGVRQFGQLDVPIWKLPEFEEQHPGFRLKSVTYEVIGN